MVLARLLGRFRLAKAFSQRKLDALRRKWQKLLRLQDWRITSNFVNPEFLKEITGTELAVGACDAHVETKEARISVLGPEFWSDEDDPREQDVENTVVHELWHCHFAAFAPEDKATELQHEQTIEVITEVMMKLDRGE